MHRTHFPLIYCVNGMTLQINCYQFVLITVPDLKMQMRSTLSIIPGCKNGKDTVALKARCLSLISNRANKCTQIHISSLSGTTFFVFSIFLFPFSTIFFFFFWARWEDTTHRWTRIRNGGHMSCWLQWARDLSNSLL